MVSLSNHRTMHRYLDERIARIAKTPRESSHFVAEKKKRRRLRFESAVVYSARVLFHPDDAHSLAFHFFYYASRRLRVLPCAAHLRTERRLRNIFLFAAEAIERRRRVSGEEYFSHPRGIRFPEYRADIMGTSQIV